MSVLDGFAVVPSLDERPRETPRSKRRVAAPPSEKSVRDRVVAAIIGRGGYAIPKHMTQNGVRGTPDVLGCLEGRMLTIECKRIGYDLQPVQRAQLQKWQDAGALAGWVTSVEHLEQLLDHLHDPAWRNTFEHPGDGRGAGEAW
jgi:hypothetical protein